MNKKSFTLRLGIFLCLIFTVLFGIYLKNVNNTLNHSTQSNQCLLINNACTFKTDSIYLRINFLQPPIIEEELLINFEINQGYQILSAWIEGANMYMGKTPVIFEDKSGDKVTKGLTFLGSCSKADMQWNLFIKVVNETEKTEIYSVSFSTHTH